ncbi:MAG: hypothetical protein ACRC6V_09450 [Bacteroidales bacterium]
MPMLVRNYKQERKTAIARGETGVGSKSGDATRHRARRKKEKEIGRKLDPSEHVDHKNRLKSGGSNHSSNLRIRSGSSNMADGGKVGSRKGKSAGGRKGGKSKSSSLPVRKP